MDLGVIMVLISNTLACLFVGFQLLYVKKHPHMLPFISLFMLVILSLGFMILLLQDFEVLFLKTHDHHAVLLGGRPWEELNEVIVRIITVSALLFQFRILHLAWSARKGAKNVKPLWNAEKKALYVSLLLYISGAFIAFFVNRKKNKFVTLMHSYAGLILDGFPVPQILLNIFGNFKEYPLSCLFYIGTCFIRLIPHVYDLYRARNYAKHFDGPYIYANPGADFYSTASNVIIPLVILVSAVVIYLQ